MDHHDAARLGQHTAVPVDRTDRLSAVREAVGDGIELFTDANGALTRKAALYWADRFAAEWGVRWFEEPVSSPDPEGLRLLRQRGPAGMDIAAGEYGFVLPDRAVGRPGAVPRGMNDGRAIGS